MRHAGGLAFSIFVIAGSASAAAAPMPQPDRYSYPSHRSAFEVDLRFFHDQLSPYGDWLSEPDWGPVWVPRRVSNGWRPYTMGHWAWTDDYGWLWVSDEPYGWAVYHYGRWYPSSRYGWVWVPGYDWSPAWVTFRSGGGYCGWAPLPPEFEWDAGVGFRVGELDFDVAINRYVAPRSYTFVPERWFLDPVQRHVVPVDRNDGILFETRNVTSYRAANSVPVNRGIAVERIQGVVGRPVPRERVVDVDTVAAARRREAPSGAVPVFRPAVRGARESIATGGAAVVERRAAPRLIEQQRRQADQQRQLEQQQAQQAQQQQTQQRIDQRQAQQREAEQRRQAQEQQEQQRSLERREQAERQQQAMRQQQETQRQREQQAQADRQRAQQAQADRQRAQQDQRQREQQAREQARQQQMAQERQQAQARQAEAQQRQQEQRAQQQAQQQREEQARQRREQQKKKKPDKPNPNDSGKDNR